ncbi:MAG: hypothetical protein ACLUMK_00475, partial [Christensenellales bacterium]
HSLSLNFHQQSWWLPSSNGKALPPMTPPSAAALFLCPLTALKFLDIPVLFFRNSLDFAARHRLQ